MCLAIPAQITDIIDATHAVVNVDGVQQIVSIELVAPVSVGSYVIVHVGCALTVLDEVQAQQTLAWLDEISQGASS
jgi:hydrogenase expression/formation protein HypC